MSRWLIGGVTLSLVAGLGVLVFARRAASVDAPAPRTAQASSSAPTATVSAPKPPPAPAPDYLGVIIADQAVDVAANLDGRLADVLVRIGDRVERDTPIASLDLRALQTDLAVAKAEVKAARAAEAQAKLQLTDAQMRVERSAKLGALIPQADLDTARHEQKLAVTRLDSARAGVAEATARVAKLEVSRTDASVRAPFAGVVAARYLDPGALVHAQTPIVRLISADELRVRFAIPEDVARRFPSGTRVRVVASGAELHGTVESIAPEVDPAARMIFAEARLDPPAQAGTRPPAGVVARVTWASPP
jgi:RND family efflux transporter MFP subunit